MIETKQIEKKEYQFCSCNKNKNKCSGDLNNEGSNNEDNNNVGLFLRRQNLQHLQRRKQKKKQYKKRQKAKKNLIKHQCLHKLEEAINRIYQLSSTFQQEHSIINNCLEVIGYENKFEQSINIIIREQVDISRKKVSEWLRNPKNTYIESLQNLLNEINRIKKASRQIQNIIDFFMHKANYQNQSYQQQQYSSDHNLTKMSIQFIIRSDLQNRLIFEENYVRIINQHYTEQSSIQNQQEYKLLISIMEQLKRNGLTDWMPQEVIDESDENSKQQNQSSQQCSEQSNSKMTLTSWSSHEQDLISENNDKLKKNIRKKKYKSNDFSNDYQTIFNRINNLIIPMQNRIQCCIRDDVLQKWQNKINYMKKYQ